MQYGKMNANDSVGHIGIVLSGCSGLNTTYFTNVFYNTGSYYLMQYKQLDGSNVSTYNPNWSGKYMKVNYYTTKTSYYTYYITFEYGLASSGIDYDTDLSNTMKNNVINLISSQKSKINTLKTNIGTEASSYQSNKALYTSEQAGSLDYAAQITTQNTSITTYTAARKVLQTTYDTTAASITTKKTEIDTLKTSKDSYDAKVSQSASSITSLTSDVATLTAQKTAGKADTSAYQTLVDNALSGLNAAFALLEADSDINQTTLKTCKDNIVTKKSVADFNTCMATILPAIN